MHDNMNQFKSLSSSSSTSIFWSIFFYGGEGKEGKYLKNASIEYSNNPTPLFETKFYNFFFFTEQQTLSMHYCSMQQNLLKLC